MEALARELARHGLATARSGAALVFGRTESEPFSTSSVDRLSKEARNKAKIAPPTLHTGRHATVSHLIRAGLDAKTIQTYAGHSSIKTTYDVYGHLFPSTIDTDRDRLNAYWAATAGAKSVPNSEPETTGQDGSGRV